MGDTHHLDLDLPQLFGIIENHNRPRVRDVRSVGLTNRKAQMSLGSISGLLDYRFDSRIRGVGLESTADDSHRRIPAFEFTRSYGYTTSQALKSHRNSKSNLRGMHPENGVTEMVRRLNFTVGVEDLVGRFKEDHRYADSFGRD
jgi:hypothetical protein